MQFKPSILFGQRSASDIRCALGLNNTEAANAPWGADALGATNALRAAAALRSADALRAINALRTANVLQTVGALWAATCTCFRHGGLKGQGAIAVCVLLMA